MDFVIAVFFVFAAYTVWALDFGMLRGPHLLIRIPFAILFLAMAVFATGRAFFA